MKENRMFKLRRLSPALVIAVVALFVGLAAASPPEAFAKKKLGPGKIVVPAKVTLKFPTPGLYLGRASAKKAKIKKDAGADGNLGPGPPVVVGSTREERQKARNKARRLCKPTAELAFVTVTHLSFPPFVIGADVADGKGNWVVSGAQPPKGDPVSASKDAKNRRRFRTSRKYRRGFVAHYWLTKCKAAKTVKPYPW